MEQRDEGRHLRVHPRLPILGKPRLPQQSDDFVRKTHRHRCCTADDQDTAPIVQVDLTAEDDDTAQTAQVDLTAQDDNTAQTAQKKTKKKKRKGKSGSARDTAKIRRLEAEGTPAAKAAAEVIRRKRCGALRQQQRREKHDIGKFLALCVDTATSPEQHYMKIAERNAEAASSSQQ